MSQFKECWLRRIGYPSVTASTEYDPKKKTFKLHLNQESTAGCSFPLPVDVALVNQQGKIILETERVFHLTRESDLLVLEDLQQIPAFASLNRDYSFYGTFRQENATPEMLRLQASLDPSHFNRVEAMRQLTDRQRIALLLDPQREIDPSWLSIYGDILADSSLSPGLKAYFLRIDEQPLDRDYVTWYRELVAVREKLMAAINGAYKEDLVRTFLGLDTYGPRKSPKDGIEERILKHVLLDLIACDDSPESHGIILDHYRAATTAQDRVSALIALNRSSTPERRHILEDVYAAWHSHISGYANYLRIVSSGTRDDVFDLVEAEKARSTFSSTNPTWSRALFLTMAANTKMIWKDQGIEWIASTIIEMAPLNAYLASKLLNVFQHARRLKPELQTLVVKALERIVERVPETVSPTINGQARAYLS